MTLLTEAPSKLVRATVEIGPPYLFMNAVITPANMDPTSGGSTPTMGELEVSKIHADVVATALVAHKIRFEYAPDDGSAHTTFRVNFGYDTLTEAIRKLAELIWKRGASDPRYWFSLGGNHTSNPDLYIVDLERSHRKLLIYQNTGGATEDQPVVEFSNSWWVNFQNLLNDTEQCAQTYLQWGDEDHGPTHIEVLLTDEAAANFEYALQALMLFAPQR